MLRTTPLILNTPVFNRDVISMPDKWEYPWYASWDLAFHMIPFAVVDPVFAKSQVRMHFYDTELDCSALTGV